MTGRRRTPEARVERWADRLAPLVLYCENDQPYDKEDQELIWMQGHRVGVGDFLTDRGVADALQQAVAAKLSCRECGRDDFGLWDEIGIETAEEREHRERWAEWAKKYSGQFDDFATYLAAFPYLALAHPLGRRIRKAIADFPRTTLGKREWWRARTPDGARRFRPKDMAPPPPEKATSEGRFNHYGQVVFYLASEPEAAMAETLDSDRGEAVAWTQRFSVPAKTEVLDLVQPDFYDEARVPILALGLMHRLPALQPRPGSPWKPEYFIPRFIADCAREEGIAGVVFESQKHMGHNLALFRWTRSRVRALGQPDLRTLREKKANDFDWPGIIGSDF
jgi:hypothetical protein